VKVLYLSLVVLIADQLSKFYIKGVTLPIVNLKVGGMQPGESIPVIGDFFRITFTENPGMAFGFNPGSDFKFFITIFSVVASIGLLIYLYSSRKKSLSLRIAIALILAGALGNVFDRVFYGVIFHYAPMFYGKVVDFFDFDFFNFTLFGRSYERWPIFNIADASVTVGVLILLFFYKKHQEEEVKLSDNAGSISETETLVKDINDGTLEKEKDEKINGETYKGKEIQL